MRSGLSLVILFCTTDAIAAPPLDLVGRNAAGEQITVYGVGDPPENIHSVIVIRKDGDETRIKNQKCYDRGGTFSCEPGGTSPLAGAFYRFKAAPSDPAADDSCGGLAVCERGCGPRTPPELIQYYECYDAGECPNFYLEENGGRALISAEGDVATDNVNLRWNPHLHSIILRTVPQGTRVVARAHTGRCEQIGGKLGVWVFVDVGDGQNPKQGWMFDAFIKYQPPKDSKPKVSD